MKPSVSLSELDILPLKATTTTEKKFFGNGTSSELKVCPMIPPNLHGAVKVVRTYLTQTYIEIGSQISFENYKGKIRPVFILKHEKMMMLKRCSI